jgi:CRISPR/Cas system endoribonuclease Cas6 (RAMP superfamily)
LITTYELTASTTDRKLWLHPFPTLRLRGLIGECIYRYSKANNSDLYHKFFKPTKPSNQLKILRRLILPKPYIILPPQHLHSNKLLIHLRVFGYPNQHIHEVLQALTTTPCKIKLEAATVVDEALHTRIALQEGSRPTTYTSYRTLMEKASSTISKHEKTRLTLEFLTPFQLTREGKPITAENIKPSDIVRYASRRLFILDTLYYSKGRELPFPLTPTTVSQLMEWADKNIQITVQLSTVKGFYHDQHLLTGKITTQIPAHEQGEKTIFLLLTSQYLGIGKWTAYGMGQYTIRIDLDS